MIVLLCVLIIQNRQYLRASIAKGSMRKASIFFQLENLLFSMSRELWSLSHESCLSINQNRVIYIEMQCDVPLYYLEVFLSFVLKRPTYSDTLHKEHYAISEQENVQKFIISVALSLFTNKTILLIYNFTWKWKILLVDKYKLTYMDIYA